MRTAEFLKHWSDSHVGPQRAVVDRVDDQRPINYAKECLIDAQLIGISERDIIEEVGSLRRFMMRSINVHPRRADGIVCGGGNGCVV